MSLIKHRPLIELQGPPRVRPGVEASCRVVVTALKPLPIEAITATLEGEEWNNRGDNHGAGHRERLLTLRANLAGPGTLIAGANELSFSFVIPEGSPSSFSFGTAVVEYRVKVEVDIDWWPDAASVFAIDVQATGEVTPVSPRPRKYTASAKLASGATGTLELSLSSDIVDKGGYINFAVGGVNLEPKTKVGICIDAMSMWRSECGLGRWTRRRSSWPN